MQAAGRTLSGERGVNDVSIHTDVCRGCGVTDMPGVLGPEHLGATRRARFRSKERVLDHGDPAPEAFTNVSNACAARVLILPIHLSSALSPRYFVGRSSRCGNTSPRGGNRAGVVFAGLRTSERSHGCRRASGRRLQQGPALRVTQIASPIFRYELVARAPVGSGFRPNSRGRTVPPGTTISAALSARSPRAARNTPVGSLVARGE